MQPIANFVKPTQEEPFIGGGRAGTVICPQKRLVQLFGQPQPVKCVDEKVTKRWVFQTPRGHASIRDYWWNGKDEWSIDGHTPKAARWLIRHLRTLWLPANNGSLPGLGPLIGDLEPS